MASKTATPPARNGDTAVEDPENLSVITLQRLETRSTIVSIQGVAPVIPHRWTEKARRLMLDKQQGKATTKREPKDPEQEAHDSTYWLDDGRVGMPATAFKAAIVDAARFFDKSVTFEALKRVIHVFGEGADQLVPIVGEANIFEAMPRNSGGTADLRYRYQIWPWEAELKIDFLSSMLTPEALITLVDAAGRNGVGDWRPSSPKSKTGTFGTFRVKSS